MKMLRICNCWIRAESIEAVNETEDGFGSYSSRVTIITLCSGQKIKFSGWFGEEICKKLDAMEGEEKSSQKVTK